MAEHTAENDAPTVRGVLAEHFVMWHDLLEGSPGEWRCACGKKFGFSDSAIDHVAAEFTRVFPPGSGNADG